MRGIRPTAKLAFLACLGLILYGIVASSGAGWLYVITASVAAVIGVSVLWALPSMRAIEVIRHVPPVGTAGEPLRCALELRNTDRLLRFVLEVEDRFAGGSGRGVVVRARPGEATRLEYAVENPRRGVHSGGEVIISSAAPFGLLRAKARRARWRRSSTSNATPRTSSSGCIARRPSSSPPAPSR